jgi:FemAB-related protein (PEP-CTERM system-associated)
MKCRKIEGHDPRWDEFVRSHPQGTFFHLLKWRDVVARNFGHVPFYFYTEERDKITGILPLFSLKSMLFGRSLVSVPLAVYGGVVADSEAAEILLLEAAKDLARKLEAGYVELRGNPYRDATAAVSDQKERLPLKQNDLYVTFIREIDASDESNFSRIPRKQRRMIRQGEKQGLRSIVTADGLNDLYRVYAESVRNLGTPVYPKNYFQDLQETFQDQCRALLVEHQGKCVAGVLTFFYKDQLLPYYSGSLRESLHLAPNDFMYWQLMSYGAANGYRTFDFGRSKKGTGSFDFKRHWGFEPRSLPYVYYQVNGRSIPDTSSLNPKLQWAIKIWRRLPLWLTMALGPRIARHLP